MGTDSHDPDAVRDVLTPRPEQDFGVRFWVDIKSHGHPHLHGPKMVARVKRELELMFGANNIRMSKSEEGPWFELPPGATQSSSGPESSATSGPGNGAAPTVK